MALDYFYGDEAGQFSFYRIPKILFVKPEYSGLSTDAKLLYGLMLDRMQLSVRNRWIDAAGRVFIYYTMKQIMGDMGCASQKAAKLLDELESSAGLIKRERTGSNKPNRIYVKNFMRKFENQSTGSLKIKQPEVRKTNTNNTDNNETDISDTETIISISKEPDMMDEYNAYTECIRDNIAYSCLVTDMPFRAEMIDEIIELMADVMCSRKGSIRICGDEKPVEVVKSRFMKLNDSHIRYVLACLDSTTVRVRNIKAYLLAALYNAPATISSYYSALYNNDRAMGKV